MNTFIIAVGKRLRRYRLELALNQEQLAEKAGLHPTYVGQVERGEKNLTLESLGKLCDALEISFPELFEGMERGPQEPSIPLQCYELVCSMDQNSQRYILRILTDIRALKTEK